MRLALHSDEFCVLLWRVTVLKPNKKVVLGPMASDSFEVDVIDNLTDLPVRQRTYTDVN